MANALADAGIIVIDNSSTFRLDPDCPLVVPGGEPAVDPTRAPHLPGRQLHGDRAVRRRSRRSSAPSGCAACASSTYQAVSGAGRAGLDALADEEAGEAAERHVRGADPAQRRPAGRLVQRRSATTAKRTKVAAETRKTLNRPDLHVAATCVRVPVRRAHSEAVFFETERPTSAQGTRRRAGSGARRRVPRPRHRHAARRRGHRRRPRRAPAAREPTDDDTRFMMWVVGDQLRKGAATNGVQILELLIEQGRFAGGRIVSRRRRPKIRRLVRLDAGAARDRGLARPRSARAAARRSSSWSARWGARPTRTPPTRCSG